MAQHDGRTADPQGPEPTPLWRNRDYNIWWSGVAVSRLGTSVSTLAFPLLVLASTGSAAAAGGVGTCGSVGLVAGLLPAGVAADRYPRRALLIGSSLVQLAAMGVVFGIVAAGRLWLPLIAVVALVQGLASAAFTGAAAPLVKRIVPASQVRTAFARVEARDYGAQLAGAPLGGALFSWARWAPFLVDALSFGAVALACLFLRTPLGPDATERPAGRPALRHDLGAGLAFIRGSAFLRYALLWMALMNLFFTGIGFMFIVTLRHHGASPSQIGAAESIATACGLGGALAAGWVVRRLSGYRIILIVSWMVAAGVGGIVLLASRPWLAALCLGASILFVTPLNVVFASGMVAMVPDAMTARVMTSANMASQSCGWLAPVVCGALADGLGVQVPLIAIAVGLALLAVANHVVPVVRQLGQPPEGGGESESRADPDGQTVL
ncbi:MFS transporter [Streptomyces sp. NPDC059837]|uniref:MFS transporter n=1 Tax=unclassified Streptomyces TaxID=2593676 RepID=UPI0022509600|nr:MULTISPECIES: MFS transporter [unclassified Streptomyces]MCX4411297.1 MFS transporter [Streptomyces sp. NBC_01764]MCX5192243.1 MFS transporter [Streptomyces sp. NBC_00268]